MMAKTLLVDADLSSIDFAPSTTIKEIVQNVKTILTTMKGEVPLDRDFGVDVALVDQPIPLTASQLTTNIIEAIETYEPRVTVSEVAYSGDAAEGTIIPSVKVVINDESA